MHQRKQNPSCRGLYRACRTTCRRLAASECLVIRTSVAPAKAVSPLFQGFATHSKTMPREASDCWSLLRVKGRAANFSREQDEPACDGGKAPARMLGQAPALRKRCRASLRSQLREALSFSQGQTSIGSPVTLWLSESGQIQHCHGMKSALGSNTLLFSILCNFRCATSPDPHPHA